MAFPKKSVIEGIAQKMIDGVYEVFVCKEEGCIAYQEQGGPCIFVNPPHPDRMPVGCQHVIPLRKYEITVEPLTCPPDDYEHED